jgi:predicted nucleotide-binding protein
VLTKPIGAIIMKSDILYYSGDFTELPDFVTGIDTVSVWQLRHTLLRIKAEKGIPYILDHWAELSEAAKIHLIDLLMRNELIVHAKRLNDIALAETSLPVLTSLVEKFCFTESPHFKDVLHICKEKVGERTRDQINDYLTKISDTVLLSRKTEVISMPSENATVVQDKPDIFFAYAAKRRDLVLEIARYIENENGVKTLLMDENTHSGRTLTEKFEEVTTQCRFGVFVLTADEQCIGTKDPKKQIHKCPRQNVILELGYFWGRLGRRGGIAILVEKGVDIPSDVLGMGVIWITSDLGKTKLELSREIKQAGIGSPQSITKAKRKRAR